MWNELEIPNVAATQKQQKRYPSEQMSHYWCISLRLTSSKRALRLVSAKSGAWNVTNALSEAEIQWQSAALPLIDDQKWLGSVKKDIRSTLCLWEVTSCSSYCSWINISLQGKWKLYIFLWWIWLHDQFMCESRNLAENKLLCQQCLLEQHVYAWANRLCVISNHP